MTATRSIRAAPRERPLARVQQLVRRAGERQQPEVVPPPREAFEWCSTALESTRVPAGSAAASTLIASVVLRTKTTASSARRADELGDGVARVLERGGRDLGLQPLPRCTLLYQGMNASTASHTATITGVLAA